MFKEYVTVESTVFVRQYAIPLVVALNLVFEELEKHLAPSFAGKNKKNGNGLGVNGFCVVYILDRLYNKNLVV